jgi:hypothetical protein
VAGKPPPPKLLILESGIGPASSDRELRCAGEAHGKEVNVLHKDKGDLRDRNWRELCEAASREHDPQKLLELIKTLNDVLEQREKEEKAKRSHTMAREELLSLGTVDIIAA